MRVLLGVLLIRMPYYVGNSRRDPTLENHPHQSSEAHPSAPGGQAEKERKGSATRVTLTYQSLFLKGRLGPEFEVAGLLGLTAVQRLQRYFRDCGSESVFHAKKMHFNNEQKPYLTVCMQSL